MESKCAFNVTKRKGIVGSNFVLHTIQYGCKEIGVSEYEPRRENTAASKK